MHLAGLSELKINVHPIQFAKYIFASLPQGDPLFNPPIYQHIKFQIFPHPIGGTSKLCLLAGARVHRELYK
jgi:hypothetical protein